MKILWIINIMLPAIAQSLGEEYSPREGWLSGTFNNWNNDENLKLSVAYPIVSKRDDMHTVVKGIDCYAFVEDLAHPENDDDALYPQLKAIMNEVSPDIVHIFGTEFPHALAAAKSFNNPQKTLLGIQGVCTKIADEYMALIPKAVQRDITFRDFIRHDSLLEQKKKFLTRAARENKLISMVKNITGRTAFDMEASMSINPDCNYYPMNETMRDGFYTTRWNIEKVKKHSIFVGQGDYPIKGLHFLLMAAGQLKLKYPDMKIYIAGNSIINKNVIKTPAYGKYLKKLIKKYDLANNVFSTGTLNEEGMLLQYLSSGMFLCASYVENSPNTLAEAMLLGQPIDTSDAGGITCMIDENEGFIFERGNVSELARLIDNVFELEDKTDTRLIQMCERARKRALEDYCPETNHKRLLEIYREII